MHIYGITNAAGGWYFGLDNGQPIFAHDSELAIVFRDTDTANAALRRLTADFPELSTIGLTVRELPF